MHWACISPKEKRKLKNIFHGNYDAFPGLEDLDVEMRAKVVRSIDNVTEAKQQTPANDDCVATAVADDSSMTEDERWEAHKAQIQLVLDKEDEDWANEEATNPWNEAELKKRKREAKDNNDSFQDTLKFPAETRPKKRTVQKSSGTGEASSAEEGAARVAAVRASSPPQSSTNTAGDTQNTLFDATVVRQ